MDARARMATLAWVATTVAVALIASVPGSPFLPLLPPGTSATGPLTPVARAVGLDRLAGDGAAFAGAFALALCAVAFLWLLVECRRGGVGARTVVVLAVVAQLGVLSLPLLLSRDVHSYAMYGRIAAVHGGNPYVDVPSSYPADPFAALVGPRWVDTPAVYGPLFTSVAAIVVRTFDDPRDVVAAFRAIAALAAVATTLVLARLAGTLTPGRTAFAVAAFGLNPVVLFHSVAGGHNDLLVALALVSGTLLWVRDRPLAGVAAVAVMTAGTLVKVTAGAALVLSVVALVARADRGSRARVAATAVAVAATLAGIVAWPYLQTTDPTLGLVTLAGTEGWLAPSRLVRRVLDAISGDTLGILARLAFPLAFVIGLALLARMVWRAAERRRDPEVVAGLGWSMLLVSLSGPMLLPWYGTWFLPFAFVLPRVPRIAAIGTSVALAVSLFATEPAGFAGAYDTNLLVGHWVITPMVVLLLIATARDLVVRARGGSGGSLVASVVPAGASDDPPGDGGRRDGGDRRRPLDP